MFHDEGLYAIIRNAWHRSKLVRFLGHDYTEDEEDALLEELDKYPGIGTVGLTGDGGKLFLVVTQWPETAHSED